MCALTLCLAGTSSLAADDADLRKAKVAERKAAVHIICHRGAAEFAHENTLEAFRAALDLGADGNEIDIRRTKDGVLVCFHDDMLDQILVAFGDVGDYDWKELQTFRFRRPGRYGEQCRIPTLEEVFVLHRDRAALMHLDIKRPDLDRDIAALLEKLDLWEHVAYCHSEHGGVILKHPRVKLCQYKGQLYQDHSEVFPEPIAELLKKPGEGVIVDDPRGVLIALGKKFGKVAREPVEKREPKFVPRGAVNERGMLMILSAADQWNVVAQGEEKQRVAAAAITRRAEAAEQLSSAKDLSSGAIGTLERRVQERSLHADWRYHGLDGATAMRALLRHNAPGAVDLARETLWRDDPALAAAQNPMFKNPRAWTDFRIKMAVFPYLHHAPGKEAEQLCRDYLALSDAEATKLGPTQFEPAAAALLALSPNETTAAELLAHRLRLVRGRAILDCLRINEPWSLAALEQHAPHALAYRVEERKN